MKLFPAIDLIGGKVVRLERGERSRMKVYSDDPVSRANDFVAQGATWIHAVDLSAAFEEGNNEKSANETALRSLCKVPGLSVDVGGHVRSMERIEQLAEMGAKRIAIGTALVNDPAFAECAAQHFGELLVADVAAYDGRVRVNGWREAAQISAEELVERLADLGFCHLVFTDIARDGMQTGIDIETYRRIAHAAGFPVVASGGISSLDDIRVLMSAGSEIIEGCIVGRAIYEGNFTVAQALAVLEEGD